MLPRRKCKMEIKVNLHNLHNLTKEHVPVIKIEAF